MTPRKKTDTVGSAALTNALIKQQMTMLEEVGTFRQRLAGLQFGGKRDTTEVAGYLKAPSFRDYWALYCRDGIAGRIVDMPSKTTWRTPPQIVEEDMEETGTDFTLAFTKLAKRVKLWHYFGRIDRMAGVGRYAVLFIGTKGGNDAALKTELTSLSSPEDILYLTPYNEENATVEEWETDPSNERFGLPRLYKLRTANNSTFKTRTTDLIVHASRVLHVAEDKLEDDVYGRPRLERVLNRLMDLDKVAASTGEAYWQLATQILQAKIDKEVDISSAQLAEMDKKLGEMVHDLRRQFTGKGIELGWVNTTTPNVQQVADFYFSMIAGSSNIPKRILFGSEMGELASSQDQENYFGQINERQEQFAEPEILRPFIDRLIKLGALPAPILNDGEYQVNWVPLYEESDDQKAGADLKRAQIAQALTPVGGNPRELTRITAEGRVELVEREADDPMDMLLPADASNPANQPPDPAVPSTNPGGVPGDGQQPSDQTPADTTNPPGGSNA